MNIFETEILILLMKMLMKILMIILKTKISIFKVFDFFYETFEKNVFFSKYIFAGMKKYFWFRFFSTVWITSLDFKTNGSEHSVNLKHASAWDSVSRLSLKITENQWTLVRNHALCDGDLRRGTYEFQWRSRISPKIFFDRLCQDCLIFFQNIFSYIFLLLRCKISPGIQKSHLAQRAIILNIRTARTNKKLFFSFYLTFGGPQIREPSVTVGRHIPKWDKNSQNLIIVEKDCTKLPKSENCLALHLRGAHVVPSPPPPRCKAGASYATDLYVGQWRRPVPGRVYLDHVYTEFLAAARYPPWNSVTLPSQGVNFVRNICNPGTLDWSKLLKSTRSLHVVHRGQVILYHSKSGLLRSATEMQYNSENFQNNPPWSIL